MASQGRGRVREVLPTLFLGFHEPGPKNSITDVPGVLVSTQTIHRPVGHDPAKPASVINTGVTTILPRKDWFNNSCYSAVFSFNGSGEMTGSHWINETGLLNSPIVITNSYSIGSAYSGVLKYLVREYADKQTGLVNFFALPVVTETYDGHLNDIAAMVVTPDMIVKGIDEATCEPVREGNNGGGTGMMTMGFKAGTGSASRNVRGLLFDKNVNFTVGCLVQSNFGKEEDLRFGTVPVGRLLAASSQTHGQREENDKVKEGSIIVVLATDAPLHPTQLGRLVKRATVGVSRTGGWGSNTSGDLFIAFSTANEVPHTPGIAKSRQALFTATVNQSVGVVDDSTINGLFEAAAEAVEESILNALCMAETTEGPNGHKGEAIDLDQLKQVVANYNGGR